MTSDRLVVDFSSPVGPFRGGASGTLYGLGDDGVPTAALLNGAHLTNTSQKAPFGTQHPSGDALAVEEGFFAKHGRDMYIYIQDHYPDWPYHGGRRPGDLDGRWSFLDVVERITEAVATRSARPRDYVLIPFNEPDGDNWYPEWPEHRERFLADWLAVVTLIRRVWARHGLGSPRIGGPGDMQWQPERTADFLEFAVVHDCLPEVFIWHELGIDNLGTYRGHLREYRAMEAERGIAPLEVNITEYGMLRDMAVPGQLIQWLALFEDTKVDAQMAYWNYAGNLSDNTARAYRFQAIAAAAGEPARHALFVDGEFAVFVDHPAELALNERSRGKYRGSAEALVALTAGPRQLSLRTSIDGATVLPGAEVTLDRFVLTDATDGDRTVYPAAGFRLLDGATLDWSGPAGAARLGGRGRADSYVTAWESGYHDVTLAGSGADVAVRVNGGDAGTVAVAGGSGVARVFLVQGVNELEVSCPAGAAAVSSMTVTRAPRGDSCVVRLPWSEGLVVEREGALEGPGEFVVVVRYANAELRGSHDYNPQVVDRHLDVIEDGRRVGGAGFRYTHSWDNFWERAIPVTLTTVGHPLRLEAPSGEPPLVRGVAVAPLRHPDRVR